MIWTILSTIVMFIATFAAILSAKRTNNKVRDNYIAHWIYFFTNLYNCVYFVSTIEIIKTQGVYAIRNILFFIATIVGIRTYGRQLKEQKENECSSNNS